LAEVDFGWQLNACILRLTKRSLSSFKTFEWLSDIRAMSLFAVNVFRRFLNRS
jgi:hypothetical protein